MNAEGDTWNELRDVMLRQTKLEVEESQIEEICEILDHHHSPGVITTKNFEILYDADWLVNLKDEYDIRDRAKLNNIIERVLLTQSGRTLAREIYLPDWRQCSECQISSSRRDD